MYTPGQLTRQLADDYRSNAGARLLSYNPSNPNALGQSTELRNLTEESAAITLKKLMTLTRPEVKQRQQLADIELQLGIRSPSSMNASTRDGSLAESAPRWNKYGGGFITAHHKGRCSLDPKLIPVNTPGAGNPDLSGVKQRVKGMGFGASTTSRGLDTPSRKRRGPQRMPDISGSEYSKQIVANREKPVGTMISSGTRYGPAQWQSTELRRQGFAQSMTVHAARTQDKSRCSPGPRYNSSKSMHSGLKVNEGVKFATNTRFHSGTESFVPPSQSPGPIYKPDMSQVKHALPISSHMAGREVFGDESVLTVLSPGPQYNPAEVAERYLNTSSSFSFGPSDEMKSVAAFEKKEMEEKMARRSSNLKSAYAAQKKEHTAAHEKMNAKIWGNLRASRSSPGIKSKAKLRQMNFY